MIAVLQPGLIPYRSAESHALIASSNASSFIFFSSSLLPPTLIVADFNAKRDNRSLAAMKSLEI